MNDKASAAASTSLGDKLHALVQGPGKDRLAFLFVMSVGVAVTIPFLGSTGFFDPWETNYAEVARQMAERNDYLYPFWKDAYFFSKPILLFWLTAPLYWLVGAGDETRELSFLVEWVGRLPVALFSLLLLAVAFYVARRLWNTRAALLGSVALATTPFFGFMSRQAITDTLYVAPMSAAMLLCAWLVLDDEDERVKLELAPIPWWLFGVGCAVVVPQMIVIGRNGAFLNRVELFGNETATRYAVMIGLSALAVAVLYAFKRFGRDPWLMSASILLALATLGKGPHAVVFVLLVFFVYFLASGEWNRLERPTLILAAGVYLLVAAPWVIVMLLFGGKDDQQKTWYRRFVLHDLLGRMGGVHGERGTHDYYIRYLSFGLFQWVTASVLAVLNALSRQLGAQKTRTRHERFTLLVAIWAVALFAFFTIIGTKFHHYIYPVVIPSALLIGWWLDELLKSPQRLAVGLGVLMCFVVVTVTRDLITEPWQWADLYSYHYVSYKPDYYFPKDIAFRLKDQPVSWWQLGIGACGLIALAFPLLGLLADWAFEQRGAGAESTATDDGNPVAVPDGSNDSAVQRVLEQFASPLEKLGALPRQLFRHDDAPSKNAGVVAGLMLSGVLVSIGVVHVYMAQASQHWTHRHILHTYWEMSQPGEPLIAFQMDWKGETFYAHNSERQIKKSSAELKKVVDKPGRTFVIVQQDRYNRLKSAVGKENEKNMRIVDQSNTKWYLVLIE